MAYLEPLEAQGEAEAYQFLEKQFDPSAYTDEQVLAIVLQDVRLAENRAHSDGYVTRLAENEKLFHFTVPQRFWAGTQIPKAAMGVPLVLEHVNAINAAVNDIMFEEDPPFFPLYHPATPPNYARACTEILSWELDKAEFEDELEAGTYDCLLDGTAVWKSYWYKKHGYWCAAFDYLERKHVLVAPSCRRPNIAKARWKAHRMFKTIRQVDQMRTRSGYNIPPLDELIQLGVPPQEPIPTNPLEYPVSAYGSMSISAEFDQAERREPDSIDPYNYPLEVIEYCNDKYVWVVLQRKKVIHKANNEKQDRVRYYSAYFIRQKGKFDGKGCGELLGNEQRLQQGLLNLFLDHLSVSTLGMYKRRKGFSVFNQPVHVSPGKVVDVDNIDDFDVIKLPPIDNQAFAAIQESEARSARRSGANEVAVQGAFPDTSGGIGRTAFGMNMLSQAATARIRKFVKVIEKQVFIPFLEFLVETNPDKLSQDQIFEILGEELGASFVQDIDVTKLKVYGSKIKFKMLGATKMKRRASMLQAVPSIMQFFQQPDVLESLKGSFKKLNYNELLWMWFDATGWPNKATLIEDMTQEEQMQVMSENELLKQLMIQKQRIDMETSAKIKTIDAEHAGRAGRDVIKAALEDGAIKTGEERQMAMQMGQNMANKELDAEMSRINAISGQQPTKR